MTAPWSDGWLDVGNGHRIYYAQYGCPDAPAAVVLHGGPGSRCHPHMTDWFNLSRQRVILFDQRGAGRSTPAGGLANNTSDDLLDDIDRLRRFLTIPDWLVVGGSWGAMLALAYAGRYPQSVRALVLRGVFLPSKSQLDWFFQSLCMLVPVAWSELTAGMTRAERQSVLSTLSAALLRGNHAAQHEAALRWGRYEDAVMAAMMGKTVKPMTRLRPGQLDKYRLQAHYLLRHGFAAERRIFRAARQITAPAVFVHGTHDWICPPNNLVRLSRFMPSARLKWVHQGTHTPSDPAIYQALCGAIEQMEAQCGLRAR